MTKSHPKSIVAPGARWAWPVSRGIFICLGLALWLAVFAAPLIGLYVGPSPAHNAAATMPVAKGLWGELLHTCLWAGAIASAGVVLGFLPGKMLGLSAGLEGGRGRQVAMLFALMGPLLLPNYVLYYGWSLLYAPQTAIGKIVSADAGLANFVNTAGPVVSITLWYWPLAALVMAQGWRNIDKSALEHVRLETGPWHRLARVHLPLMAGSILLAWAACFVLTLSEFTTFHLSMMETIGTRLAVLLQQTGDVRMVARACLPVLLPAALVAWGLWRGLLSDRVEPTADRAAPRRVARWQWAYLLGLLAVSCLVPIALMVLGLGDLSPVKSFIRMHWDELLYSALASGLAAAMSLLVAWAALAIGSRSTGRLARLASNLLQMIILVAMLLPPVLLAGGLLKMLADLDAPTILRESILVLSAGLTMRYAGLALLVMHFARRSAVRELSELAAIDGATPWQTFWHVHLPRQWLLPAGAGVLIMMMGMTEIPATLLLLPPGLPNFAQRLLNQMHYSRDQAVIASCLVLIGAYLAIGLAAAIVAGLSGRQRRIATIAGLIMLMCLVPMGCRSKQAAGPKVLSIFGRIGEGDGEMVYPRAIAMAGDGSVFIADKTGRILHYDGAGNWLGSFYMPEYKTGKPNGLTVGPDGYLYIADTHYHRVLVTTFDGKVIRQVGRNGSGDGQFMFPTDIAFVGSGATRLMLVSEYGGNDRISVFTMDGKFVRTLGSFGSEEGQFSRPSSMLVDEARGRLYVADACNHRIAIYDMALTLKGYIGSGGTDVGQLRYPYGLALKPGGDIVVSEFGNNRLQIFSPEGVSRGTLGSSGRESGQLTYPWGVAVDAQGRAFVVDGGNNRIQVWQF